MANVATGKKQYNSSVDSALLADWKRWIDSQPGGLNEAQHLEMAMRRHMANPPALPYAPPLPPITLPQPAAEEKPNRPRGRAKKEK